MAPKYSQRRAGLKIHQTAGLPGQRSALAARHSACAAELRPNPPSARELAAVLAVAFAKRGHAIADAARVAHNGVSSIEVVRPLARPAEGDTTSAERPLAAEAGVFS